MFKERIMDISKRNELSHIGSNLSAVDIIDAVYGIKKPTERFVLSSGHTGLALYTVLESHGLGNAEEMLEKAGIHADKKASEFVDVSTGSLGQGLPIAVGMALAERNKNVYCLVSDEEMAEGSIWEALRVATENNLTNLKVICNFNGWAAYRQTDANRIINMVKATGWTVVEINGHDKNTIESLLKYDHSDLNGMMFILAHTKSDFDNVTGQDAHYSKLK